MRTLLEQNLLFLPNECVRLDEMFDGRPALANLALGRAAKCFYRALIALRIASETDERAQIHQGRIEPGGFPFRDELVRANPKRFAMVDVEQARQNPGRVRLDNGNRTIEGEGSDRVRGVAPDAGKSAKQCWFVRQDASMSILHKFRGGVEMARAAVVTEALPGVENVVRRSAGQGGEIRKSRPPSIIIRHDRGHLGLLKHELGDEDGVGIERPAPWEIATVALEPIEKGAAKLSFRKSHR